MMTSCRSKKTHHNPTLMMKETFLKTYRDKAPSFQYLEGRAKVHYQDDGRSYRFNIKYRIEKDKKIWIQANMLGFPVAKMLVTPGEVLFYEKIKGNCFRGAFELLEQKTGVPFDFSSLQNLFLGLAMEDLGAREYDIRTSAAGYELTSTTGEPFHSKYSVSAEHYRLTREKITYREHKMQLNYPKYTPVNGQMLPEEIFLDAFSEGKEVQVEIRNTRMDMPEHLRFPFHLPEGCNLLKF